MKRVLISLILAAAFSSAANVFINPVCVHTLGMLGAPVAPGGDFVQVFVTDVAPGDSVIVTLYYSGGQKVQTVTANQIGAVAIFHVEHGSDGFRVSIQTSR